jgi:predicted transcriptional regulator YheO
MMSERERILNHLQQVADAIVSMFGKNCETCIHDLEELQNSLIYISGSVTGRTLGAPATDLLVKALKQPVAQLEDMHNYRALSGDGRTLKSSTVFIRDSQGTPLFAFCINFDTTDFFNASQALAPILAQEDFAHNGNSAETFAQSPAETIEALFLQAITEIGKQPATMSTDEKTLLVEILERNGALQFKGAVEQIALLAGVSKYTIYNYLKKVHTRQSINHI